MKGKMEKENKHVFCPFWECCHGEFCMEHERSCRRNAIEWIAWKFWCLKHIILDLLELEEK